MNILILGYGNVGRRLCAELGALAPDVYDKYNQSHNRITAPRHDVAFICVDTPRTEESDCDVSAIMDCLSSHEAEIYVIKSTVLPGTTEMLARRFGKRIVFSPEYYGYTQHALNAGAGFTVLGGEKADCVKVQQVLQNCYDASHRFRITDSKTAELAKYMENAWLATKVSFCHEFFDVAERIGVDYEDLREIFVMDPRVNPSHTFVYRDHPYWSSHCLDKDVPAIMNAYDMELLRGVFLFNEKRKPE